MFRPLPMFMKFFLERSDLMIDKLLNMGIREIDIKNMVDFIDDSLLDNLEVNIKILKNIGCNQDNINNIIVGNPYFLKKDSQELKELIYYMNYMGFKNLDVIFDSYTLFLNIDARELDLYIREKLALGLSRTEIINALSDEPWLIDEVEDEIG